MFSFLATLISAVFGAAVDFVSRTAANFLGHAFSPALRAGGMVAALYMISSLIYHFLAGVVGAFQIPTLGRSFFGSDVWDIVLYAWWLSSLDRLLPFALALLPVRLFWGRLSFSP